MWLALACQRPAPPAPDRPAPSADTGRPPDPGPHSAPASAGHTGAPWPEVRCGDLVPAPLAAEPVPGLAATHDVAFGPDGRMLGSDDATLWWFTRAGAREAFVPGLGPVHQLEALASGAFAVMVADSGLLERVLATGGRLPLGPGGYAVRLGPDGALWTADGAALGRVDPATGGAEVLLDTLPAGGPKVLAFAPDGGALFLGTVGGGGALYRVPVGPAGPGTPEPWASAGGGWHDALALDACGNLYVTDASTHALYRVDPTGAVEEVLALDPDDHLHGLRFGTGEDGWRADALYGAQPYGGARVVEIAVGVPGADWRGGRYTVIR